MVLGQTGVEKCGDDGFDDGSERGDRGRGSARIITNPAFGFQIPAQVTFFQ